MTVIANYNGQALPVAMADEVIDVAIVRHISLYSDLRALFALFLLIKKGKFSAVHSVTPKAGLLTMGASWLARVPVRLHTYTGQVWFTKVGFMRVLLKFLDWLIYRFSTDVLVDSVSQRNFLIDEKVIGFSRTHVLGKGSINGVDVPRFTRNDSSRAMLREKWYVGNGTVLLFLGRACKDKGINELLEAFLILRNRHPELHLVFVGPDEDGILSNNGRVLSDEQIHVEGKTETPELYYSAADIFVLPSYREGFGTSVLEAAAASVPAVVSNIYGLSDAVENHVTGLLHEPKNVTDLCSKLETLISNPEKVDQLGAAALKRVRKHFTEAYLAASLEEFYLERV